MFKVPIEILVELKREFPDVPNIEVILDKTFEKIFKKTIRDGSCAITRLCTFFAYKAFSNRLHKIVPRFKFSVSRALRKNLAEDSYTVNQIPETREMSNRVALIIEEKKNQELEKKKSRRGRKRKTPQDEIAAILDERFGDDKES